MFNLLQSHLLLETKCYVRERVPCAFTKVLHKEKQKDMKTPDGQMDAGQNSLSFVCTCTGKAYLIYQPYGAKS